MTIGQYNSQFNESNQNQVVGASGAIIGEIEVEYGYNTEEESIFNSFSQDNHEQVFVKQSKPQKINLESSKSQKEVKEVLRRVSEKSIIYSLVHRENKVL